MQLTINLSNGTPSSLAPFRCLDVPEDGLPLVILAPPGWTSSNEDSLWPWHVEGLRSFHFHPWGKTDNDRFRKRRYGRFTLPFASPVAANTYQIYVIPSRVLTPKQHQRMIEDLTDAGQESLWSLDSPDAQSRAITGQRSLLPIELLRLWLDSVPRQLDAVRRVSRRPFKELMPARPGQVPIQSSPKQSDNFDLPENRIALAWCLEMQQRSQLIQRHIGETLGTYEHAIADLQQHSDAEHWIAERERERSTWQRHLNDVRSVLNTIQQEIAQLRRIVTSPRWTMNPSIRRRPDPLLLAEALVPTYGTQLATIGTEWSTLGLQPSSFLYEAWCAVTLVNVVVHRLGWTTSAAVPQPSAIPGITTLGQAPLEWTISRGNLKLRVAHGPTAIPYASAARDRAMLAESMGHYPDPLEYAYHQPNLRQRRECYISCGKSITPDYFLLLEKNGRVAFCIADALYTDLGLGSKSSVAINEKLSKLRTYTHNIGYVDSEGRLVRAVPSATLAIIPGDLNHNSSILDAMSSKQSNDAAQVLILTPGCPDTLERAGRVMQLVLNTLEWHIDHR